MIENPCLTPLTWLRHTHRKHMPSSPHQSITLLTVRIDSVVRSQRHTDAGSHERPPSLQPGIDGLSAPSSSPWIKHRAMHTLATLAGSWWTVFSLLCNKKHEKLISICSKLVSSSVYISAWHLLKYGDRTDSPQACSRDTQSSYWCF